MVGRVGDDPFAAPLLENLARNDVQTTGVYEEADAASGIAVIAVEESGENNIIIASGANRHVDESDVARLDGMLAPADILLLQLEVPLEMVIAAAHLGALMRMMYWSPGKVSTRRISPSSTKIVLRFSCAFSCAAVSAIVIAEPTWLSRRGRARPCGPPRRW